MTERMLHFLSDLAYSRIVFFREARSPSESRFFLSNEALMLNLLQTNTLTTLLFTADSFADPVRVRLTAEQIESVLEPTGSSQDVCCICQEQMSSSSPCCKLRGCAHTMHRECANQWFSVGVRCPICRRDVRENLL